MKDRLFALMLKELRLQKDFLGKPVQSIYFGGGTPSLLSREQINSAIKLVALLFELKSPEITLECNPDDLTPDYLSEIRGAGINRLSIGIQSFVEEELRFMNRVHTSSQAEQAINNAREAGFSNLNLDLIYGIPGSTLKKVEDNLTLALSFHPEHISTYSLTIEPGTVFGNWHKKGNLNEEKEEEVARQYELISERLTGAGYIHYEISNFARPGYESVHNSNYWKGITYLGIGPAAHSYSGEFRQFNVRNNAKYMAAIEQGVIPMEREYLSNRDKINEYLLTSLRTSWGCDLTLLNDRYGYELMSTHKEYISELQKMGKIEIKNNILRLSLSGKLLADQITSYLFL